MKFKKGDEVVITIGKDKGKKGKIEAVFPKRNEVIVAGVNIYKRHLKPRGQGKPGGIVDLPKPLSLAKIALVCSHCGKPTRVGYQKGEDSTPLRICRKCKGIL